MAQQRIVEIQKYMKLGRYQNLPERVQEAYWLVVDALSYMKKTVTIPSYSEDELLDIYQALRYDYPELRVIWNYSKSCYIINKQDGKAKSISWYLTYNGSHQELEKKLKKINMEVQKIIVQSVGQRKMSDEQCVEAVYKCLAEKMTYSKRMENNMYPEHAYTMECLLEEDGVCAGIASVFNYIMRQLQIPSMVISGKAEGGKARDRHAWNIVQMPDGTYKHIDATWDVGKKGTTYLALDDLAMKARRHAWNMADYPVCM